jgi:rhamnulokinase
MDAAKRSWATELFDDLGLPSRLLPQIFEPGTILGSFNGTPVIAPACHDTGSAVAAVATQRRAAFLSSGTWSLLGTEVPAPVMTPRALELNFTNEGGVCGTTRLLKNIGGLWLLQSCRRDWHERGQEYSYEDLVATAGFEQDGHTSIIDPDDPSFLNPPSMIDAIAGYCRATGQPVPATPGGYTRTILESLAIRYGKVLESLEELIGYRLAEIRIIGGGSKNHLLNQLTANATGRPVIAGPVEATALGNIAMQMLATGAVSSLADARAVIERSFPTTRYEPPC